jgi:peptidoglycan/LPS O-acetylase OafA/YrhL
MAGNQQRTTLLEPSLNSALAIPIEDKRLDAQNIPVKVPASTEKLLRPVMPELDSIRGIAILAVLFYHGLYWQVDLTTFPHWQRRLLSLMWPGRLGVNLFFVLSGFLITGLLMDSRARPNFYRRFYVRRALRILPIYLALLVILGATHYAPPSFLILSLAYLSNLTPLFGVAIAYPVLWSLAVEEHFYFVWPAIVRKFSSHRLLILSIVVIVASPILRFVSAHSARGFEFNDYTWNSLDGMACGALVAILLRMWGEDRRKLLRLVCAFYCAAIALYPFAIQTRQSMIGAALQVVPWHFLFAGTLGVFLLIGTTQWKAFVLIPFFRFFGYISYGLYLIHVLAFNAFDHVAGGHGLTGLVLRFICASSIATLVAWLSRRYFEERFLSMKPASCT